MLRTLRIISSISRNTFIRNFAYQAVTPEITKERPPEFQDDFIKKLVSEELITIPDFITEEEEQSLMSEIDPVLSRSRYQTAHWDDVILILFKTYGFVY